MKARHWQSVLAPVFVFTFAMGGCKSSAAASVPPAKIADTHKCASDGTEVHMITLSNDTDEPHAVTGGENQPKLIQINGGAATIAPSAKLVFSSSR